MEEIHKKEQSPDDAIKGKIKLLQRHYDIPALMALLSVSEERILYAAKKLPKGWKRSDVFTNTAYIPSESLTYNVRQIKRYPSRHTVIEIADIHKQIIAEGGSCSQVECLLIRYTRNLFKKPRLH